jgi:hypothetical protein
LPGGCCAKEALADQATYQLYQEVAKAKNTSAFALCVADYLRKPAIEQIDSSAFTGRAGDSIKIVTSDDFGVVDVNVRLIDADEGTIFESGPAIEDQPNTGYWTYTASMAIPAGILIGFEVTAKDRPGGKGFQVGTKPL